MASPPPGANVTPPHDEGDFVAQTTVGLDGNFDGHLSETHAGSDSLARTASDTLADQEFVSAVSSDTAAALRRSHLLSQIAALPAEDRELVLSATANLVDSASSAGRAPVVAPSSTSNLSGPIFTSEAEQSAASGIGTAGSQFQVQYNAAILELAMLRIYIPLPVFLARSIRILFLEYSTIPKKTHFHHETPGVTARSGKYTVLDLESPNSPFPDEKTMSIADWVEAWQNMKVFLKHVCDDAVYQRWLDHFNFCFQQQDFQDNFSTILMFDIRMRREYFAVLTHIEINSEAYRRRFDDVRQEVLQAEFKALRRAQNSSSGVARTSPSKTRMESPYARPTHSSSPSSSGAGATQRRREARPPSDNNPMCLTCGRQGHRFSECTESSSESVITRSISVHCAGPPIITHAPVHACSTHNVRNLIVTPYNADAFEKNLQFYGLVDRFPSLVHNLRHGFPLGYNMMPIRKTFTPPNHPSASEHRAQVLAFLEGERAAGRMSGPLSRGDAEQILGGPFRTSPIHVVVTQKADGSPKYRITINLSFPDESGMSVNDMIDSDDFPTVFNGPQDVENVIVRAPPGTQAASLDIASAFRTIPILPEHKKYVVIMFEDVFWIDHCTCFGCASSGGNQGNVADATVAILEAKKVHPVMKWVDDFILFRNRHATEGSSPNPSYQYDLDAVRATIADLNIPWHETKGQEFSEEITYVGLTFNIATREVWLPEEKRLKFKKRVDEFLASFAAHPAPLEAAQKINGSLSHAAFVYPHGRTYLSNLCTWMAKFESRLKRRYIPHSVQSDLKWWSEMLSRSGWKRVMTEKSPPVDLQISVDASTDWGIGLVWGEQWDAWKLTDRKRSPFATRITLL